MVIRMEKEQIVKFLRDEIGYAPVKIEHIGSAVGRSFYKLYILDASEIMIWDDELIGGKVEETRYIVVENGGVRWANAVESALLSGGKDIVFIDDGNIMEQFVSRFKEILGETYNVWVALRKTSEEFDVGVLTEIDDVHGDELYVYLSLMKNVKDVVVMPSLSFRRSYSVYKTLRIEVNAKIDLKTVEITAKIYVD